MLTVNVIGNGGGGGGFGGLEWKKRVGWDIRTFWLHNYLLSIVRNRIIWIVNCLVLLVWLTVSVNVISNCETWFEGWGTLKVEVGLGVWVQNIIQILFLKGHWPTWAVRWTGHFGLSMLWLLMIRH